MVSVSNFHIRLDPLLKIVGILLGLLEVLKINQLYFTISDQLCSRPEIKVSVDCEWSRSQSYMRRAIEQ